jgi:hypothetical protein
LKRPVTCDSSCLGLFDTCPCDATVPRVAQT